MVRRSWIALPAMVGALALPGVAEAAVPKEEFIVRADAVCERFEPRLATAANNISYSRGFQEVARKTEKFVRLLKRQIDAMQRIGEPDRGQATLERWYRLVSKGRQVLLDAGDEVRDGDLDGVQSTLDRLRPIDNAIVRTSSRFGFNVCG